MEKVKQAKVCIEYVINGATFKGEATIDLSFVSQKDFSGPESPVGNARAQIVIDDQLHVLTFNYPSVFIC